MKRKLEEEEKRKLEEIEKENQRIEKELNEELERLKKDEEEYEKIGKWKSTKAPDFEENIFEAATDGKLSSVIYLLVH